MRTDVAGPDKSQPKPLILSLTRQPTTRALDTERPASCGVFVQLFLPPHSAAAGVSAFRVVLMPIEISNPSIVFHDIQITSGVGFT